MTALNYWIVLEDGRAGMDSQSFGLAEAMGISYKVHPLRLPWWQLCLPPQLVSNWIADVQFKNFHHPPAGVIGTGRRAAYGLLAATRRWPGVCTIQIQNPHIDPARFTQIVMPEHDSLRAPNVTTSLGSVHRISDVRLAEACVHWQEKAAAYPRPRVAVLIGGNNKYFKLQPDWMDDLIAKLHALLERGMSLWITVSRRTPEELIERLRKAFSHPHVWFWDGAGENPYLGFLALADYFLVTADSVNMISEALFTDKPVALLRMPGEGKKFTRFYDSLFKSRLTHWFNGDWEIINRPRLREPERIAQELLK